MGASPVTPNAANIDGQVITIWCDFTSGGGTTEDTFDLPTYAPKIDLRVGHPVLSMALITTQTDSTGSQNYSSSDEIARGTAADSGDEWRISDLDTIAIYHTADQDGLVAVTYIAFGAQIA